MLAMMNNNNNMNNNDLNGLKSDTKEEFQDIGIINFQKKDKNKGKFKKAEKQKRQMIEQIQEDNIIIQKANDERYKMLLQRVCENLQKSNIKPLEENKIKLPRIQIQPEGKRTAIINFRPICAKLNRSVAHVMTFFLNQLMVPGSLTQKVGFLIRQNLQQREVQNLFKRYIVQFVKCSECASGVTQIKKYPKKKDMVMECLNCNASKEVRTLKQDQL